MTEPSLSTFPAKSGLYAVYIVKGTLAIITRFAIITSVSGEPGCRIASRKHEPPYQEDAQGNWLRFYGPLKAEQAPVSLAVFPQDQGETDD